MATPAKSWRYPAPARPGHEQMERIVHHGEYAEVRRNAAGLDRSHAAGLDRSHAAGHAGEGETQGPTDNTSTESVETGGCPRWWGRSALEGAGIGRYVDGMALENGPRDHLDRPLVSGRHHHRCRYAVVVGT